MSRRVKHSQRKGIGFCETKTKIPSSSQPQLTSPFCHETNPRQHSLSSHLVPTSHNVYPGMRCYGEAASSPEHPGCAATTELVHAMESLTISDVNVNRSEVERARISNEIPNHFERNAGGEMVRKVYKSCRHTRSMNNSNVRSVFECGPVTYVRGGAWRRAMRGSRGAYASLQGTEQKCDRKNSPATSSACCLMGDDVTKKQVLKTVSFEKAPSIKWFKSDDRIALSSGVGKSQFLTTLKKLMSKKQPKREKKHNVTSILKKAHNRL